MVQLLNRTFTLGNTIETQRVSTRVFAAEKMTPRCARIDYDKLFAVDLRKKLCDPGQRRVTGPERCAGTL
jgi:hypothetical protein